MSSKSKLQNNESVDFNTLEFGWGQAVFSNGNKLNKALSPRLNRLSPSVGKLSPRLSKLVSPRRNSKNEKKLGSLQKRNSLKETKIRCIFSPRSSQKRDMLGLFSPRRRGSSNVPQRESLFSPGVEKDINQSQSRRGSGILVRPVANLELDNENRQRSSTCNSVKGSSVLSDSMLNNMFFSPRPEQE